MSKARVLMSEDNPGDVRRAHCSKTQARRQLNRAPGPHARYDAEIGRSKRCTGILKLA